MDKFLFVDVDGVLNSQWSMTNIGRSCIPFDRKAKEPGWKPNFDPQSLEFLGRLVNETGAKVVVSSTWRKYVDLDVFPDLFQLDKSKVVGITPTIYFDGAVRGNEIHQWLMEFGKPARFAILDDDSDMLPYQMAHFVRTRIADWVQNDLGMWVPGPEFETFRGGLQQIEFQRACTILNGHNTLYFDPKLEYDTRYDRDAH